MIKTLINQITFKQKNSNPKYITTIIVAALISGLYSTFIYFGLELYAVNQVFHPIALPNYENTMRSIFNILIFAHMIGGFIFEICFFIYYLIVKIKKHTILSSTVFYAKQYLTASLLLSMIAVPIINKAFEFSIQENISLQNQALYITPWVIFWILMSFPIFSIALETLVTLISKAILKIFNPRL